MEQSYSSVGKFFSDLTAFLLGRGLSLSRTLVEDADVILDNGHGKLCRLVKRQVGKDVVGVGWEFGTDADALETADIDIEFFMPFEVKLGSAFFPSFSWDESMKRVTMCVMSGDASAHQAQGCRYRIWLNFSEGTHSVVHADRFHRQYEPNFGDKGGFYIPAGV